MVKTILFASGSLFLLSQTFLAYRTNGRAYAMVLCPSVVYLSVVCNVCIVAKRCLTEKKLPEEANRK